MTIIFKPVDLKIQLCFLHFPRVTRTEARASDCKLWKVSTVPSFPESAPHARTVRTDQQANRLRRSGCVTTDIVFSGRYVGSRPIKLRKSTWKSRSLESVKKKEKEKAMLINALTGR